MDEITGKDVTEALIELKNSAHYKSILHEICPEIFHVIYWTQEQTLMWTECQRPPVPIVVVTLPNIIYIYKLLISLLCLNSFKKISHKFFIA